MFTKDSLQKDKYRYNFIVNDLILRWDNSPHHYSNIGSVMFSLNLLGYAFMTLSTFVTAPVFSTKSKLEKWMKRLFILHGLFFFSTIIFPLLSLPQEMITPTGSDDFGAIVLIVWCVVFTPLASLVSIYFYQKKK